MGEDQGEGGGRGWEKVDGVWWEGLDGVGEHMWEGGESTVAGGESMVEGEEREARGVVGTGVWSGAS